VPAERPPHRAGAVAEKVNSGIWGVLKRIKISELNRDFARNGWLTTSRNPQFITMG